MRVFYILFLFALPYLIQGQNIHFNWGKQISGAGHEDISYQKDNDGNYLAVISISFFSPDSVDIDPGAGVYNVAGDNNSYKSFLCKFDPEFNLLWAKEFYGIPNSAYYMGVAGPPMFSAKLKLSPDGDIVLFGGFTGIIDFDPGPGFAYISDNGYGSTYICRLDPDGNLEWAKTYETTEYCYIADATFDEAGYIYIFSTFRGTINFGTVYNYNLVTSSGGAGDLFIQKLTSNGILVWVKNIGGIYSDYARSIQYDGMGNIYMTGYFLSPVDFDPGPDTFLLVPQTFPQEADFNTFLLKFTTTGNFVWVQDYTDMVEIGNIELNGQELLLTGSFYQSFDFDHGAGNSTLYPANGVIFQSRLNTSGALLGVDQINLPVPAHIYRDGNANYYLVGGFQGTVDFDPGPGVINLSAPKAAFSSDLDAYILKLDSAKNFLWIKHFKSNKDITVSGFELTDLEEIYLTGSYSGTMDIDPGTALNNISATGLYDLFFIKLSPNPPGRCRIYLHARWHQHIS